MFGARKIASGAFWRTLEVGGNELISFLFFILMTRLLVPEQFGIVALAGALLQLGNAMLQQGIPDALIQRDKLDEAHLRSAFWAQFYFALAMVALLALLAWPIAWLLKRPEFPLILLAMAPILLLQAISTPMHAMLRRNLALRAITIRTISGTAVAGLIAVVLAKNGAGVWALIAQQWSVALVSVLVLSLISPIKPWPLRRDRAALAELVSVAKPIVVSQFVANAVRRLDILALGLFLGDFEVGIYFLISRMVFSVQMVTQHSIGEISLVVLSRLQSDPAQHRAAVRQSLKVTALACLLCYGLLGILSDHLIPLVFGKVWHPAEQPLSLMCLFATAGSIVAVASQILVSGNAARTAAVATIASALLQLMMILLAARFGLNALVLAIGIGQLLAVMPTLYFISKRFDLTLVQLLADLAPLLLAFGLAQAALWLLPSGPTWTPAIVAAFVFATIMAASSAWVFRSHMQRLVRVLGTP